MAGISYTNINTSVTPAPSWRFIVQFPTIPGSKVTAQQLSFMVQRITASQKNLDVEPIVFQAGVRHFPTGWSVDNISLTFAEDISYDVASAFRSWIDIVVSDNGVFGLPGGTNGYKQQISLQAIDYTGAVDCTFTWTDCMPAKIDGYDFDGTATQHIMPTVSFAVDSIGVLTLGNTATPTFTTVTG